MASVRDNSDKERYEITVDDAAAGFVEYRLRKDVIAFFHTEIDPAYEGQGLGSQLVRHVLDDARARSLGVLPFCPFVRGYIERHEEYVELVPPDQRALFDL